MPSYPLAFPAYPALSDCAVAHVWAHGRTEAPTSFKQQIYKHPGKRWEIEPRIQKCTALEAQLWTRFFCDLQGLEGTFSFNLNPWTAGWDPAPGTVVFRLEAPKVGWNAQYACLYDFSFRAVQAL